MATARRRGNRGLWPVLIGVGVVLALVGYLAVRFVHSAVSDVCTARGADGTTVTLDPDQASDAATIAAVAHARGLPEQAVIIALATAIQESKLRNLAHGDRDSLGLFQQRPSQGWGSAAQIRDPVYAAGRFFDALVKVPDYTGLPVTVAAQNVQHSGYPTAYARHEVMAATLANVLTGQDGPALSCTLRAAGEGGTNAVPADGGSGTGGVEADRGRGAAGVVHEGGHDAGGVAAEVRREFGAVPAAVATAGDSVTYPVTETATGWSLALWLVCHAGTLHSASVTSVTFDHRGWSSAASGRGWTHIQPASAESPAAAVGVG
ncbi:heavy metal transporter [Streptomyces sp. NPDC048277]|uniref:heavy metal transporter n=1 Tax=Streptomyces sp. NPDC048277 TaxID=3155027 RepID=UPI0033C9112D